MMRLEVLITQLIETKEKSNRITFLRAGLLGCSFLYGLGVKIRNRLFDAGIFVDRKCAVPVISIGNIVAGGTGKTPFTALLAQELSKYFRVGILSSGYRSHLKKSEVKIVCRGNGALLNPQECGDEACLLAEKVPQAVVSVGKNRYQSAQLAIKEGAQVLILDDGFQHRKLFRNIDILMVDPHKPFGNGFFLPRGFLRDEKKRLNNANYICVQNSENNSLKTSSKAPLIKLNLVLEEICLWNKQVRWSEAEFKNSDIKSVSLFCGIGNPIRFVDTVNKLNKNLVSSLFLADHQKIDIIQLQQLAQSSKEKGAQLILCTEKDFVKIAGEQIESLCLPLAVIKVGFKPEQTGWDQLINEIKKIME